MRTLFSIILFLPLISIAQEFPTKDLSFNGIGHVGTNIWFNDRAYAVAVQSDKKVIVGGAVSQGTYGPNSSGIVRYNEDGSLDTTFGDGGISTSIDGIFYAIALLDDGKIILAGRRSSRNLMVRLLPNGSLDETFADGGISVTGNSNSYINKIHLLPDGSFICSGEEGSTYVKQSQIVKLTSNGEVDTSFGDDGFVRSYYGFPSVTTNGLIVQPDGKIIIGGAVISDTSYPDDNSQLYLARYNADGSVDNDFGEAGLAIHTSSTPKVNDMALTSDNKIVVVGEIDTNSSGTFGDIIVTQFDHDGSLDESFGQESGYTRISVDSYAEYASSVLISPEGKIYLGGSYWDWGTYHLLMRFDENGIPDESFGENGIFKTYVRTYVWGALDMAFAPDNKIVLVGYYNPNNNFDFMTIRIILGEELGVEDNNLSFDVRVYPNPVTDILNIKGNSYIDSVFIYDLTGKIILSQKINNLEGFVNISELPSGTYLLKIKDDGLSKTVVRRIIKL